MKIAYHTYVLKAKSLLNNRSNQTLREGALLKIHFDQGFIGYADCHPWVELGDLPLMQQLSLLKQKVLTSLTQSSIHWAHLDAEARSQNRSLLAHQSIPPSHFLIIDLLSFQSQDVANLAEQGYTHIKVKLGRYLLQETNHLIHLFSHSPFILRLDFNEKLTKNSCITFLQEIGELKGSIEFIEDPFPFNPIDWKVVQQQFNIAFACDREVISAIHWPEVASFFVIKPAIQAQKLICQLPPEKIIITTYLDHPLGQMAAAYVASQLPTMPIRPHGLLSHHAYESNAFSRYLSWEGAHFTIAPGSGWGYDNELDSLEWRQLT